jgi:threonine/homoserine/homoserine lactone efflux protein
MHIEFSRLGHVHLIGDGAMHPSAVSRLKSTSARGQRTCIGKAISTVQKLVAKTVLTVYWCGARFNYKVSPMNWQDFTALLILTTAMSFSPGPNNTLAATLGANYGLRRAMPFVWAVPAGWGVMLALCAFGLGALLLAMPILASVLKLLGVAYLLWLASKLIGVRFPFNRPVHRGAASAQPARDTSQATVTFWQGAAFQFVNIKAWLFALTVVSGWIAGRGEPVMRFAIVLPVMLAYAFASNFAYALAGSLLKAWLAGPNGSGQRLVWFNRFMAATLVATAIWMLFL